MRKEPGGAALPLRVTQSPASTADLALDKADFLIAPAVAIGGVLLWRRSALGYAAGLALLFQSSMLFVGLIVFMLLQPWLTGARFHVRDTVVVAGIGSAAFIPLALFVRGVQRQGSRQ